MVQNSIGVNGNNTHIYAARGLLLNPKDFGGLYFNNIGDKAKID